MTRSFNMVIEIQVSTFSREEMKDITSDVRRAVGESGIEEGIAVIYNPHTTAAITINEGADPAVRDDILSILGKRYPYDKAYRHMEGNSDAHIKSALIGSDRVIPVKNSKLLLGRWQKIFFCEFDGPRQRTVTIAVIPA
jgi:secondary thiamine-phosphate synthase enzyme